MSHEGMTDGVDHYNAAVDRYNNPPPLISNPHPAIQKFTQAALRHIVKPLGNESSSKALWEAVVGFPDGTQLTPAIINFMEIRAGFIKLDKQQLDPSGTNNHAALRDYQRKLNERLVDDEVLGIFRTNVIHSMQRLDPSFRDIDKTSAQEWRLPLEAFCGLVDDYRNDPIAVDVGTNFNTRKVTTSLPERYIPTELILQALGNERFPDGVRMLEIGSSIMLVKWLRQKSLYEMDMKTAHTGASNEDLTTKVNRLLKLAPILQECVCVDNQLIYHEDRNDYDLGAVEWATSSLRPSERFNKDFMKRFRSIVAIRDPNTQFSKTDLLIKDQFEEFKDKHPMPFDVVIKPTITHQMNLEQNRQMDIVIDGLIAEDGLVIEQDFMYLNPRSRYGSVPLSARRIKKEWTEPYSYTTNVIDYCLNNFGLQKAFDFKDNSRCRNMRIHPAQLAVNGQEWPLTDLIKHQTA